MAWIRGAICAENTVENICCQTLKLFDTIVADNKLSLSNISAVIFTVTQDIDKAYPAKFVREKYPQLSNVAFVCAQEMYVVGALEQCIRACIYVEGLLQGEVKHCFLEGAKQLRPDLQ